MKLLLLQNKFLTMKITTISTITLLLCLFMLPASYSYAQSGVEGHGNANAYEMAAGLRGGFGVGATYKMVLGENKSNYIEGIGNYYSKTISIGPIKERIGAFTLKGLYERAFTTSVDGLRWYIGAGPSIGIGELSHLGLSAIGGVEFNFSDIPFNISLDYVPTFKLLRKDGDDLFDAEVGGLSIRYVIK